ncbi:hypothetical protein FE257_011860 [Aspergillus nanangensis]|uniref:Uncharacterized protein n=1 Tax=Aspergillus nanangensis TaxID=2582783 RepID=A0AAD4CIL0_ASPNN|nr:hypothetical protein FE257_011860 [Aspergillus nanangensis]
MSNERSAAAPLENDLARALEALQKFEIGSLQEDIDAAIDFARTYVQALPIDDKGRPGALTVLGTSLQRRYHTATEKDINDLDETVNMAREAVELDIKLHTGESHIYFENLERVLKFRYQEMRDATPQLDASTKVLHQLLDLTPKGSQYHAFTLNILSSLYSFGFKVTESLEYLDEAIATAKLAVSVTPQRHPFRAVMLEKLSDLHSVRFESTQSISDLDDVISVSKEAVEELPEGSGNQLQLINNVAVAFSRRYGLRNDVADIEKAIEYGQTSVKVAPTGSWGGRPFSQKELMLYNLRKDTRTYYERTGNVPRFDGDIIDSLNIIGMVVKDCDNEVEKLCKLADAFHRLYEETNRVQEIEYAVMVTLEAMRNIDDSHEEWEAVQDYYRARYRVWSEHTGMMPDSEIAYMAFAGGGSWIPPELTADLGLTTPCMIFTGKLSEEQMNF